MSFEAFIKNNAVSFISIIAKLKVMKTGIFKMQTNYTVKTTGGGKFAKSDVD